MRPLFSIATTVLAGESVLCGLMGTIMEYDKIQSYANRQRPPMTRLDRTLFGLDREIKAFVAYTVAFPVFIFIQPFRAMSYRACVTSFPFSSFIMKDMNRV